MYSAHLSLRANAHTRHDKQFNKQPNDQGKGSHTKEGRPVMPRAKPEGETKRETNQWGEGSDGGIIPVSRLLEQGPGSLAHSCPFLSTPPFPSHPPPLAPPCHRALGGQQVDPWTKEGGEGKERGVGGGASPG